MSKLYAYARVSTKNQRLDRQIYNIEKYVESCMNNTKIERIFKEKFTGTKLDRPEFKRLLSVVKSGDTIIFDSVSRMSRNAEEGYNLYMQLMNSGIELVFINEPHINTEYYKRMQVKKMSIVTGGKESLDKMLNSILDAITEFQNEETKEKIKIAFDQSQKEVDDLHKRVSDGLKRMKARNESLPESEQKHPGRVTGQKVETKKSKQMKEKIKKMSKDFDGNMTDKEILEILNLARNTYYKYKRELQITV